VIVFAVRVGKNSARPERNTITSRRTIASSGFRWTWHSWFSRLPFHRLLTPRSHPRSKNPRCRCTRFERLSYQFGVNRGHKKLEHFEW